MKILRLATASMTAVLALSLIGCGDPADTTTPADKEDAQFQKYVDCLQKNGIRASYTQDGQGKGHFDADAGPNDPKFKTAQRVCAQYAPQEFKKTVSPPELDSLVKVAACMRKQGITVVDPTVDDPALHVSGSEDESRKAEGIKATCEKEAQGVSPSPSS